MSAADRDRLADELEALSDVELQAAYIDLADAMADATMHEYPGESDYAKLYAMEKELKRRERARA
jgi:hypothetical protein